MAGRRLPRGASVSPRLCKLCLRPIPGQGRARYHDGCRPPSKHRSVRDARPDPDGGPALSFQSKKEARRWDALWLMHRGGLISRPQRQVPYPLAVAGVHVCEYRADFVYEEPPGGPRVVEDVKSPHTRRLEPYRIKKALMLAILGIAIRET
jgi:hypothetical protein